MPITPTSIRRSTTFALRRLDRQAGEDIRRMRLDAGLPLARVAAATGHDTSYLARIESGDAHPSLAVLVSIGIALGADLSLRYFAGGPRIYDRFQAPMVETLLDELDPRWRPEVEVSIVRPARGVLDLVLTDATSPTTVATEIQSELRRLEQQIRWGHEKAGGLAMQIAAAVGTDTPREASQLLVVRSTVSTRALASEFEATLTAAYPARCVDIVAALTTPDAPWPGAGIVWINLHGTKATSCAGRHSVCRWAD